VENERTNKRKRILEIPVENDKRLKAAQALIEMKFSNTQVEELVEGNDHENEDSDNSYSWPMKAANGSSNPRKDHSGTDDSKGF
jgi:CRISPR/Cas system-associated endonuclease Cas1